jgi:hypothetical protein
MSSSTEIYHIGGFGDTPYISSNADTYVGGLVTGCMGNSSICDCERTPYTTHVMLYPDYTLPDSCGNDKGMHYRRVRYIGWDSPCLSKEYCKYF